MVSEHKIRRVVTGHDGQGQSIIALDDRPPAVAFGDTDDRRELTEVWATLSETGASEFRVIDLPAGSRREMHRTETVDYGIVLAGEIYLLLDGEETLLRAGDVVVQRATNHSWHNRSGQVARMAFVNLTGQVTDAARCPAV